MASDPKAHDLNFPYNNVLGIPYPKHYVVGVIDDLQEAEKAAQALRNAGYDDEDIRLYHSQEVVQLAQDHEKKQNILTRFAIALDEDEDVEVRFLEEEARRGHHLLHVYTPTSELVDRARGIFAAYHAHTIKYFGSWAIADLPSS